MCLLGVCVRACFQKITGFSIWDSSNNGIKSDCEWSHKNLTETYSPPPRWSLTEMWQMCMYKILWQMTNGMYPSLKRSLQQYTVHNHCMLLEMLDVFSLCAAAAVSVTPNNSPPAAPIENSHPPPPTPGRHIHSPAKIMALDAMYTLLILLFCIYLCFCIS